ncbi:hypothetical protein [Streptomyces roseoverticillatus]|uniref:hypothetical protein n=1 Tax=Streptomyces roseoverticillatus TaxID=66429 RepID=UPI000A84BB59|nr:hypothetical protein [Streptomyces roseoverticillatus]
MDHEPVHEDLCPLCLRPLRPEYRRTRPSGQQNHPARVRFYWYRCNGCEAARLQQFADMVRALYET